MTDDFDITMACLAAIEQEVRRARQVLQATQPHVGGRVNAEDCPRCAIDPPTLYPFICPGDQPETPAQDAHTPREQPQTRSGGTESGEGGGGALRVFFGGDDERRMWTWECTDGHPAAFGDEPTEYKAFGALVQHWKTRHPNDLDIPKGDA